MATTEQQGPVGFAMVGCGVIAGQHAKAAAGCEDAELVGVTDLDQERASAFAAEHGIGRVYGGAEEMLADDGVDVVVLAMPVKGRARLAHRAIAAGKHVLVEKPAGMDAAEVQGLIDAAEEAGVLVGSCSCRHTGLGSAVAARAVIDSGRLGDLRVVRGRAVMPVMGEPPAAPPVWRVRRDLNAGGIMSNWGVYDLDFLLGIVGWRLEPELALARVWPVAEPFGDRVHPDSDAETHVAALVVCKGGAVLTLERGEFLPVAKDTAWEIVGEKGSVRMSLLPAEKNQVVVIEAAGEGAAADEPLREEVVWEGTDEWGAAHATPIRDFSAAVLEGREPMSALRRAKVITAITDAIYASSESGGAERVMV
ncbi:MAG: Gfo/Idh/MocA family oxidoreductase [Planctomycetota bacterium]